MLGIEKVFGNNFDIYCEKEDNSYDEECDYEDEKLYFHRNWTGFCIYIMTLLPHQNQHDVIVNRDPTQYSETDIQRDQFNLTILLNALIGHREENQKLMIQYIKMKK